MIDWLTLCLLLMTDGDNGQSVVQQQNQQKAKVSVEANTNESNVLQPSKDLLLFLAEWDETQDGQWIEPSAFAADSALAQQMDQQNQTKNSESHENNPDHN